MNALAQKLTIINREDWLNYLGEALLDNLILPVCDELSLNLTYPPVRYSVGFAPSKRSDIGGHCWARAASEDNHNEIFISPVCNDSMQVAETLAHELIHAVLDNEDGHGGRFKKIALAIGLQGKMTATVAGPELQKYLAGQIHILGDIPAAKIDYQNFPVKKKQTTRNKKVECTKCTFSFRTSQTNIDLLHDDSHCPVCFSKLSYEE